MDLDDVFGHMPQRPTHSDMWKLSEILLRMDAGVGPQARTEDESERNWLARIADAGIDKDVVLYAGQQRAMRPLGIETLADMLDPAKQGLLSLFTSMWIDGFVAGSLWNQKEGDKK